MYTFNDILTDISNACDRAETRYQANLIQDAIYTQGAKIAREIHDSAQQQRDALSKIQVYNNCVNQNYYAFQESPDTSELSAMVLIFYVIMGVIICTLLLLPTLFTADPAFLFILLLSIPVIWYIHKQLQKRQKKPYTPHTSGYKPDYNDFIDEWEVK